MLNKINEINDFEIGDVINTQQIGIKTWTEIGWWIITV